MSQQPNNAQENLNNNDNPQQTEPVTTQNNNTNLENAFSLGSGDEDQAIKKNRRQKKRRQQKHRKHSPQYYRNLKQIKQNKKRENMWDNRFYLEELPIREEKRFAKSTKKIINIQRKQMLGSQQDHKNYKTVNAQTHKEYREKKAFNVRVVNYQSQHQTKKKDQTDFIGSKTADNQNHKPQPFNTQIKDKLINQIENLFNSEKYPECQKELLISTVQNCHQSKQKTIESIIKKQLEEIKKKKAKCLQVAEAIEKRQGSLKELVEEAKKKDSQAIPEKISSYRTLTIQSIEMILNWRDYADDFYQKNAKIKTNFQFYQNESDDPEKNYLLKIGKDTQDILGEIVKKDLLKDCEGNKNLFNPFLLGYAGLEIKQDEEMRIRACELLLLEENLKGSRSQNNKTKNKEGTIIKQIEQPSPEIKKQEKEEEKQGQEL